MVDDIKDLGFFGGTISGLSFGVFDAKIYSGKAKILEAAEERISTIEKAFADGLVTVEEKRRNSQES